MAISPVAAKAAPETIAEPGEDAGQVSSPQGTGVDESSGDLYVADSGNGRIDKFDAEGVFLFAFGYGVADGNTQELQTCGPEASPPTKHCFRGSSLNPRTVAVDNSSGPSHGDVYVGERDRVSKFTSTGQLLFMVGKNVNKTKLAEPSATQAEKDFCSAASGNSCGNAATGTEPNEFASLGFISLPLAIENSGAQMGRVWVGDTNRLVAIEPNGTPGPKVALPASVKASALAIDSAENFYVLSQGTDEQQSPQYSGLAQGDTFAFGNLPAACSASETKPIEYDNSSFGALEAAIRPALEEKCGDAIFVSNANALYFVHNAADENVAQLTCTTLSGTGSCSVNPVTEGEAGIVDKLDYSGTLLKTLYTGGPRALALDAASDLFIGDERGKYHFAILNPAGETTAVFGAGQVKVDPSFGSGPEGNAIALGETAGTLFAADLQGVQAFPLPEPGPLVVDQGFKELEPTTVTLTAELNPEGDQTTYHFEYDTNPYGEGESSHGTPVPVPDATLIANKFEAEDVAVGIEELTPSTTYHFRLCATNSAGTVRGPDTAFTTLPAVLIDPEWVTDVSAQTAEVHAEMNPLGVEAEAWLEYGTGEDYGQLVTLASLGEGFDPVLRQATLAGLQAGTTYHYRFSARDTRDGHVYTVHGVDRTFTTQTVGLGFQLPDGRVWELVSPADKHGARLVGVGDQGGRELDLQASADGNGLAYQSYLSTETDPEGSRILESSMSLARRQSDGSWRSKDITPPNESVTRIALGEGSEYKLFNSDLSEAIVDPRSGTPLSPEASERTLYLRENSEPRVYTPLVTGKEPFANVPPGTEFGGGDSATGAIQLVAASPDFRHFGLRSDTVPLVQGAPAFGFTLYEWSGGQIAPVSVLPVGEGGGIVDASYIGGPVSVRGGLSDDGSRVFWSLGNGRSAISGLYVRDTQAGKSARLDVKQPGTGGSAPPNPNFQGASADGTVIFFTDSQQLTEDAGSKGADLYRCELPAGSVAAGCSTLTDISVPTGVRESAEVQEIAPGVTADGRMIYFVAKGVLDPQSNAFGDSAVAGQPNLYIWQQGEGVRFIATLANADSPDWGAVGSPAKVSAAASPTGRYLAFMSQRSLTGYDNRDGSSGELAQEVFRYDAATERLDCVSCDPTGGRTFSAVPSEVFGAFVDPWKLWAGRPVAAALPEATSASLGSGAAPGVSLYRPRTVLDNGRVFFNAIDPLAPVDSNHQWDVYQYEPTGVGDCSSASAGASTSHLGGGCASLISSGTAEEEAAFFDADLTGDNAFFFTPAQLSVLDEDHEVDIYDARVGGIAATRSVNAECLGEACHPAAQAPDAPTPASSAFTGAGNVKPARHKHCGKGKRRVRRKGKVHCVSHSHKHRHNGRTSRRAHR